MALAADVALGSITLDYLDLYGLRPAVERVQAAGITARVASPRVLKPDEQRIVNFLRRLDCEVVVRSGGLLAAFQEGERPPLIGDFSLNAANVLSAASYFRLGIERLAPTHDLNAAQVADLAREFGPAEDRGHRLPAPAGIPYRALCLLPLLVERHQLQGLRASL